jgi:translation initiation factor 1
MSEGEPPGPFNNPFGKLNALKDQLPSKPAATRSPEVTVVEQLGLPPKTLEKWLKELKQALGCGGTVEDDALVLQGDHRERLPAVLEKRGVRRISVG